MEVIYIYCIYIFVDTYSNNNNNNNLEQVLFFFCSVDLNQMSTGVDLAVVENA